MSKRKVFDSDDEIEFECLGPEKTEQKKDANDEDNSSEIEGDSEQEVNSNVESDSDDAPDDIDFAVSKQATLDRVKSALKQIESDKKNKKDRRKNKDELYKLQKRKRLEELESKKLPEDFLEKISSNPGDKGKTEQDSLEDRLHESDDDDDSTSEEEEGDNYLSLNKSESIMPVYIKDVNKEVKTSAQIAADFRNNALFGKDIKRESTKAMVAKKVKKKHM